jgi:phospholipase/carboxylesterase
MAISDTDTTYVHRLKAGEPGSPLLVVLHGTGGDENQFFRLGAELMPHATILSPRGDVSEHGAARFFRRTGEGVYDMVDLARATAKLAALVRSVASDHAASEVIGLGYSNGANILANVMFEEGDLFDRAVLMHPLIPFAPKDNPALAGRRVLITAGEHDPICPAPLTRGLANYFTRQGASVTLEWHPGGHELRQNEVAATQAFLAA